MAGLTIGQPAKPVYACATLSPHVFIGYARMLACMFHPHDAPERRKFFDATVGNAYARRMADGKPLPEMPDELRLEAAGSLKRAASPVFQHSGNIWRREAI